MKIPPPPTSIGWFLSGAGTPLGVLAFFDREPEIGTILLLNAFMFAASSFLEDKRRKQFEQLRAEAAELLHQTRQSSRMLQLFDVTRGAAMPTPPAMGTEDSSSQAIWFDSVNKGQEIKLSEGVTWEKEKHE